MNFSVFNIFFLLLFICICSVIELDGVVLVIFGLSKLSWKFFVFVSCSADIRTLESTNLDPELVKYVNI